MRALVRVARETVLDGAGARCSGSRTLQEHAQGAVGSESASSRDIPSGPCAQTARPRRSLVARERCTDDLDPLASKHLVKSVGELLVPIANQETDLFCAIREGPRQLPSLLRHPRRVGSWCASGQMHPPAAQLDEEQHVEPLQPDRLHGEESTAKMLCRCARTNSRQVIPRRVPAGPSPAPRSHVRTVVAETARPRPFSSPTIR